jgi:hypothetical protein
MTAVAKAASDDSRCGRLSIRAGAETAARMKLMD